MQILLPLIKFFFIVSSINLLLLEVLSLFYEAALFLLSAFLIALWNKNLLHFGLKLHFFQEFDESCRLNFFFFQSFLQSFFLTNLL